MNTKFFPVIDLAATGNNIRRLRIERGLTVRDIQSYFGFDEPRAVYQWQHGESLKKDQRCQRAAGGCLLL